MNRRHPFREVRGSLVCGECGMTPSSVRHSRLGSTQHAGWVRPAPVPEKDALALLATMLHEDYHVRNPGVVAVAECDEYDVHGKRVAELVATPSGARLLAALRVGLATPADPR